MSKDAFDIKDNNFFDGLELGSGDKRVDDESSVFDYYIPGTENGNIHKVKITPGNDYNTEIEMNLAYGTDVSVHGFVYEGNYHEVVDVDWGWSYEYDYPSNQTRTFTVEYPDGWTESFTCVSGSMAEEVYFNSYLKSKGVETVKGVGANTYTTKDGYEIRVTYTTSDGQPAYQRQPAPQVYSSDVSRRSGDGSTLNTGSTSQPTVEEPTSDKYSDQELINRAVEGNGVTTGNTFYDSMGVLVPVDFARFVRAVGEAVGVERGNDQSNLWYYPNYDYDESDPNIVRLDQGGIDEVVSVLKTDGMMAALNAYANGASWEESGMSAYNDLILKGFTIDDYSPEEKSALAEKMFWQYYIRNFGDVDTSDFSQDYGYSDGRGLSNYFSLISVEAGASYDAQRLALISDLKVMLKNQLAPVNEAMGFTPGTPPVTVLEITDDDYDAVGNNYYTNQIVTYNSNYKDAADKLDNMITKLTSLYDSFNNAVGTDITKIKNDLSTLINDLNSVKTKVQSKKRKTNENAEACQRCFNNWNTRYGKASINSEGIVYRVEITGEDDNQEKTRFYATIDEMLNS